MEKSLYSKNCNVSERTFSSLLAPNDDELSDFNEPISVYNGIVVNNIVLDNDIQQSSHSTGKYDSAQKDIHVRQVENKRKYESEFKGFCKKINNSTDEYSNASHVSLEDSKDTGQAQTPSPYKFCQKVTYSKGVSTTLFPSFPKDYSDQDELFEKNKTESSQCDSLLSSDANIAAMNLEKSMSKNDARVSYATQDLPVVTDVEELAYYLWLDSPDSDPKSSCMSEDTNTLIGIDDGEVTIIKESFRPASEELSGGIHLDPLAFSVHNMDVSTDKLSNIGNNSDMLASSTVIQSPADISTSGKNKTPEQLQISIPDVRNVVPSWKLKFPWMEYITQKGTFICKFCDWALMEKKTFEVFALKTPQDVFGVAKVMRLHADSEAHKSVVMKYLRISVFLKSLYTVIKNHLSEVHSTQGLMEMVTHISGTFWKDSNISTSVCVKYLIKIVADYIQDKMIIQLSRSPFFSVVAIEDKGFAIVRWIDDDMKAVEHVFTTKLFSGRTKHQSIQHFLETKKIDLSKMVSYHVYYCETFCPKLPNLENRMWPVPLRPPSIHACIDNLQSMGILNKTFEQILSICKLFKFMPHKFSGLPGIEILASIKEPYVCNCILDSTFLTYFFKNFSDLQKIAKEIFCLTGNLEALGFSVVEANSDHVKQLFFLLNELHEILTKPNPKRLERVLALNKFREKVLSMQGQKGSSFILANPYTLLNIFLSHVLLTQSTQHGWDIVEAFFCNTKELNHLHIQNIYAKLHEHLMGNSQSCLSSIKAFTTEEVSAYNISLYKMIEFFTHKPELKLDMKYPDVHRLCQIASVMPFLAAQTERYVFNIAGVQLLWGADSDLLSAITIITLEGQKAQDISVDEILQHWSLNWKKHK